MSAESPSGVPIPVGDSGELNPSSAMEDGLEELEMRRKLALQMGGSANVDRHRAAGKLDARTRIDLLADEGTFRETGMLAGRATYDGTRLVDFVHRPNIDGMCQIDGRKVVVTAGDFTSRAGSHTGGALGMELHASARAREWQLPYVRLLDGVGGSVRSFEELGRTYLPDANQTYAVDVALLDEVPVVSAVLGSVAGLPAVSACLSHWNVMVRETSQLFPGGPPVVKAALGYEVTKEELGGSQMHTQQSGVVDNVADSEEEAIAMVQAFLSFLPSSVAELPPLAEARDPLGRPSELRGVVPRNPRLPIDSNQIIDRIVDDETFFEIAPHFGRSRITGLARVDGVPVGIMASNPMHLGGATDRAAGEKTIRLIQLCDTFHLPMVSIVDEPGFMVGLDSEREGIERAGARLLAAVCRSRMPHFVLVVGRLFGVAGQSHHRPSGLFRRYAWPTARWGSMHLSGGVDAAYRREIEAADDPTQARQEIIDRLEAIASPFRSAEATAQDIIDPAESRDRLVEFVHDAWRVLGHQLGRSPRGYTP